MSLWSWKSIPETMGMISICASLSIFQIRVEHSQSRTLTVSLWLIKMSTSTSLVGAIKVDSLALRESLDLKKFKEMNFVHYLTKSLFVERIMQLSGQKFSISMM